MKVLNTELELKNNSPLEYNEQVVFVEYLEILKNQGKILAYTAIPQNTWTRSWGQKIKAKKEGVRPGFPDIVIVTKDRVVFLEMKRKIGSKPRSEQKEWLEILKGKETLSTWTRGANEAIEFIKKLT